MGSILHLPLKVRVGGRESVGDHYTQGSGRAASCWRARVCPVPDRVAAGEVSP